MLRVILYVFVNKDITITGQKNYILFSSVEKSKYWALRQWVLISFKDAILQAVQAKPMNEMAFGLWNVDICMSCIWFTALTI